MKNTGWIAIALAAGSVLAQQPRVENARAETRPVSGGLDATLRAILSGQTAPAWVGYAEPMIPGSRQMCCWNDDQRGCFLEPHTGSQAVSASPNQTIKLEGPTHVVVLYRVENHQVEKIRSVTTECELDAGGLQFIWLTGATPAESVHYLLSITQQAAAGNTREQSQRVKGAVSAIALHADPSADQALEQLAGPAESDQVRRQAIFWLGNARGQRGFEVVSRILREDPNDKIREHAIFALTQSQEPEAMNAVVRAAHDDTSPRVRGQALFWLAQKAAQKTAQAAISDAIANDPETEVKTRAVFALTQMPAGEGVPLLIQITRNNQNAAVRKQAMFWLGQSKDPRALAYIEEVLK
ncbi:MAG TPA: HEAT repeat domain-containing protein [Bryobacteraceae bacterium]|nr:HEAT repeat domain-containing protein [Bryobacteraceae bacterium]